jgi:NAD(P)H-hydrate epimerase
MNAAGVELDTLPPRLPPSDIVIDAVFGTGFSGEPSGEAARAISLIDEADSWIIAVDMPSGLDGTTGTAAGSVVRADLTIALGAEKLGTATAPGFEFAGEVETADIGIEVAGAQVHMVEGWDVAAVLPRREPGAHKGSSGAVAVLAGSDEMTGAALLTCRAAGRMGAGYVRLGTTERTKAAVAPRLPEVLTRSLGTGTLDESSWDRFKEDVERSDALALGPGLGTEPGVWALVETALTQATVPLVLDADALNVLAGATSRVPARAGAVMTPHPGELGRLLGVDAARIQEDRVGSARRAAQELGCVVLLKGARTVVAQPSGEVVMNPTGGPALAAAGSGDVLTGVVGALLAAGLEPFDAAWAGAYIHGLAGEVAEEGRGALGVLAGDVADLIPEAARRIQAGDA